MKRTSIFVAIGVTLAVAWPFAQVIRGATPGVILVSPSSHQDIASGEPGEPKSVCYVLRNPTGTRYRYSVIHKSCGCVGVHSSGDALPPYGELGIELRGAVPAAGAASQSVLLECVPDAGDRGALAERLLLTYTLAPTPRDGVQAIPASIVLTDASRVGGARLVTLSCREVGPPGETWITDSLGNRTRASVSWSEPYPGIHTALLEIELTPAMLDGRITKLDISVACANGKSEQTSIHITR